SANACVGDGALHLHHSHPRGRSVSPDNRSDLRCSRPAARGHAHPGGGAGRRFDLVLGRVEQECRNGAARGRERRSDGMTAPPELLYLLAGDPAELAETLSSMHGADVAEALNALRPEAAARVMAALPFDLAVRVFDEPELVDRSEIFEHMDPQTAGPIIEAMSADQQAELF